MLSRYYSKSTFLQYALFLCTGIAMSCGFTRTVTVKTDNKAECCICFELLSYPDNYVALQPCCHANICGDCAITYFIKKQQTQCPTCNQRVVDIVPASFLPV